MTNWAEWSVRVLMSNKSAAGGEQTHPRTRTAWTPCTQTPTRTTRTDASSNKQQHNAHRDATRLVDTGHPHCLLCLYTFLERKQRVTRKINHRRGPVSIYTCMETKILPTSIRTYVCRDVVMINLNDWRLCIWGIQAHRMRSQESRARVHCCVLCGCIVYSNMKVPWVLCGPVRCSNIDPIRSLLVSDCIKYGRTRTPWQLAFRTNLIHWRREGMISKILIRLGWCFE